MTEYFPDDDEEPDYEDEDDEDDEDDEEIPTEIELVKSKPRAEVSVGETDGFISRLNEYEWIGPQGEVFSPSQVRVLLQKIMLGIAPTLARKCAGIDRDTLEYWLAQGKDKSSKYRDFVVFYRRQRAEAEALMLQSIYNAAGFQWQAAKQMLEIIAPGKYNKKQEEIDREPVRVVVLPPGEEP